MLHCRFMPTRWPDRGRSTGEAERQACTAQYGTSMAEQTAAQRELAILIVESLNLESVEPTRIEPDAPLFGGDLGLDSIDALEIALAVSKKYGFQLRSDNPDNRAIFASLRSLAEHIEKHRATA